jgi:hypothetical protein
MLRLQHRIIDKIRQGFIPGKKIVVYQFSSGLMEGAVVPVR